jgi:hypothetical protein
MAFRGGSAPAFRGGQGFGAGRAFSGGQRWAGGYPGWRGRHGGYGWRHRGYYPGFATGLALGGSYAYAGSPYYYDDTYYYDEPTIAVVEGDSDSTAYCMQRFKSYDPASGTYLGYDGKRHPCP